MVNFWHSVQACPVSILLNPSKGSINLMFAMYEKFDTFEDL